MPTAHSCSRPLTFIFQRWLCCNLKQCVCVRRRRYTDIVGDHPLNIGTTTQVLLAYMLTGDAKYEDHVIEYIDAWCERTADNGGLIPSNIGLDGTIGGECDGQWWGGAYGWGFNCANPVTGVRHWRSMASRRTAYGFGNALLLTGQWR
jgi:hypothetical protein